MDGEDQHGDEDQLEDDAGDGVEERAADKSLPTEGGTGEAEQEPADEAPDHAAGNHGDDERHPDIAFLFR